MITLRGWEIAVFSTGENWSFQRAIALEIPEWGHEEQRAILVCCVILPGRRMADSELPPMSISCPSQVPGLAWGSQKVSEAWRHHLSNLSVLNCSHLTLRCGRAGFAGSSLSSGGIEKGRMQREQQGRGLRPRSDSSLEGASTAAKPHQDSLHTQALMSQGSVLPHPLRAFPTGEQLVQRHQALSLVHLP